MNDKRCKFSNPNPSTFQFPWFTTSSIIDTAEAHLRCTEIFILSLRWIRSMWKREWWQSLKGARLNYICRHRVLLRFLFFSVFPSTFRRGTQRCVTFRRTNRWGIRGCGICQHISNLSAVPLSTRRHSCLLVRTSGHRSWGCWFDDDRSVFRCFIS